MYKINPFVGKGTDNAIPHVGSVITEKGRCIYLRQSFSTDDRNSNEVILSHFENVFAVKDIALSLLLYTEN